MRRAPAKPVRACTLRKSHLKLHFALHTSPCTLHTPQCTLHTSHFTLHSSQSTLHTSHSTLHISHFTVHTSQSTLHTSHFSLLPSHSKLHTAFFTPHTSHCTLHTPHFISSELFSPYPNWALLISSLLVCHLSFHALDVLSKLTQRRRKLRLQNRISTPKRQKDDFEALFKRNFKRKIISAKIEKICWQFTFAALMQPFQYDLRSSAAKDNSITHAAAAPSNLDAPTTMRSAETELQSTIELRATVSQIAAPKPDGSRRQSRKKTILKHFLKDFLKGKLLAPKLRKSADKSPSQPGCSHSNTIYDVQLQKTIVLRMQP